VKRLLMVGGGHAHLLVLESFLKKKSDAGAVLVTPSDRFIYSGMLPGVVAGHYKREQIEVDLASLAERAGVELIMGELTGLDAARRTVKLADGRELGYELLSLDVGAGIAAQLPGAGLADPIRPFQGFLDKAGTYWEARIAVIGGGTAGVEMAMALRHRGNEVAVYSDRPGHSPALAARIADALRGTGVSHIAMPVSSIEPGPVVRAGMSEAHYDAVILATGAAAHPWLRSSGLATDEAGFVLVDRSLRSTSHPEVLALGDCATVEGAPHPRSGLYAIRQAEAMLADRPFQPQQHGLAIITCGGKYAIAQRGATIVQGTWVWYWKDWIDRRWLRRFRISG
jgi:NADH dehydrogenase FAD-containing subunit